MWRETSSEKRLAWKKNINVDHFKVPFCQLLDEFCPNLDVEVIEVNNGLQLKDKELKAEWIQFHDEKVIV